MWHRHEIKRRGRNTLKKAYWPSVFVALIIYFLPSLPRNINKKESIQETITTIISQPRQLVSTNGIVDTAKTIIDDTARYVIAIIDTIAIHNIMDLFTQPIFVCLFLFIFLALTLFSLFISSPWKIGTNRYFIKLSLHEKYDLGNIIYYYKRKKTATYNQCNVF